VTVKAPAELPYLAMIWKVPKLTDVDKDREAYALDVLSSVLDGHDAARLPRRLVREQKLAVSAGAGYDGLGRGEAVFYMSGMPAEGHTVAELEAALRRELQRVADEGVDPAELERVKVQAVAAHVYKRDSMFGQAMEIGGLEAVGLSWRDEDKLLEQLRSVTAEEVQAVAKKYFSDDGLTVGVLDPQPIDPNAPPKAPPAGLKH